MSVTLCTVTEVLVSVLSVCSEEDDAEAEGFAVKIYIKKKSPFLTAIFKVNLG